MQRLTIQPHFGPNGPMTPSSMRSAAGSCAPGQRLTQDQLAARSMCSRQPMLQALVLLRKQGFVRDTGRRGVVVSPLDPTSSPSSMRCAGALDARSPAALRHCAGPTKRATRAGAGRAGRAAARSRSVAR